MRMMSLGFRINQPHSTTPWHSRVSIFPMRVYGLEWTQDSEGSLHGGCSWKGLWTGKQMGRVSEGALGKQDGMCPGRLELL